MESMRGVACRWVGMVGNRHPAIYPPAGRCAPMMLSHLRSSYVSAAGGPVPMFGTVRRGRDMPASPSDTGTLRSSIMKNADVEACTCWRRYRICIVPLMSVLAIVGLGWIAGRWLFPQQEARPPRSIMILDIAEAAIPEGVMLRRNAGTDPRDSTAIIFATSILLPPPTVTMPSQPCWFASSAPSTAHCTGGSGWQPVKTCTSHPLSMRALATRSVKPSAASVSSLTIKQRVTFSRRANAPISLLVPRPKTTRPAVENCQLTASTRGS